ncbi:NAD-dependent epimerase/dehydratase family protein [Rhizobium sp. 2YAF20]|uniref:NAD-dependent epimerase/dehydratase family protein n=1 Tax=Rhizobium sp. 2YAF20 TaxID=3233027 RepID=UPI003F9BE720
MSEAGGASQRHLVLGGRGFIGGHLVDALLTDGQYVRCLYRPIRGEQGSALRQHPNLEIYEGDFTNERDVARALKDCDICYHLISTTLPKSSNEDPAFDVESNLLSTIRLLQHGVRSGLKKVVFVSSGGTVYGVPQQPLISEDHPTNPIASYGITKLAIEKYLQLFQQLHGLDYVVLRLANPFGQGQRVSATQGAIAVFIGKILRGEALEIWGDGSVVRDYVYIQDVVEALLAAARSTSSERIFNIGSGVGHSLNEVISSIEAATGMQAARQYQSSRSFDVPRSVLDIERARRVLGWTPKVSFDRGVHHFATWLLDRPHEW